MKRLTGLIYVFILCLKVRGQLYHVPSEEAYFTSGAYSTHFRDAFSFLSNTACLGSVRGIQTGIVCERKWMLKELNDEEAAICLPLGNGGLGMAVQYNGDADYKEQGMQMGYGVKAGRLEIGTGFSFLMDQALGYKATGFGSARAGICFHMSEKWTAGWELGLPVFGVAGKTNPERGPQYFNMGIGYEWAPDLFLSFRIEKMTGLPVNITGSIEYNYEGQFFFVFGINGLANAPYFQSGWKKNRLRIQLYSLFEPVLGFSPGICLLWDGKNRKE